MAAILTWLVSLGLGLGLLEMTRSTNMFALNTLIAVAVSGNLAIMALREFGRGPMPGHADLRLAVTIAWLLAVVWVWLAIASLVLASSVHVLADSLARVGGPAAAALLCASFAVLLDRARRQHAPRHRRELILRLTRLLAGMHVMAALAIVGSLISSRVMSGINANWAANNALFFGAIALGAIATQAFGSLSKQRAE